MTGVYKISNIKTGQIYIGSSIDIKRRWMEHRTPKASGNDKLHGDMKTYGLDNFCFEVLEECEPEALLAREQHFIKMLQPYYNTVGRPVSEETRRKISEGTKKWWDGLPKEAKIKIINNNLTGPKKGHQVSKDTRERISKRISEIQKQPVICVETGEVFESVGAFEKSVGACAGTCAAYWRGKIKTVKGYHVEKCRD